jgi:hypothetical protein
MSDEIFIESPPTGTNWTCQVEGDLRQIARYLRHVRHDLMRSGDWYAIIGKTLGFIAFVLAILNSVLTIPVIKILLPIFVGVSVFADLGTFAVLSYDKSFELQAIIDAIRSELLLPICSRIDGVIFLRTVQMDRSATLSEYLDESAW